VCSTSMTTCPISWQPKASRHRGPSIVIVDEAIRDEGTSLHYLARAREAQVAMVALVSNSVDQVTGDFDTGGHEFRTDVLSAVVRAALAFVSSGTGNRQTGSPAARLG
jgi:hypothetical protein